jgi:hypothetical protein
MIDTMTGYYDYLGCATMIFRYDWDYDLTHQQSTAKSDSEPFSTLDNSDTPCSA